MGSTDWSADPDFLYLAVDRKKLMTEQTSAFDGKKACWVPDEKEGYVRAEINPPKERKLRSRLTVTTWLVGHLPKSFHITVFSIFEKGKAYTSLC